MGKQNPTAITLDGAVVDEYMAILFVLDTQVLEFKGTWATKVKAADEAVAALPLDPDTTLLSLVDMAQAVTVGELEQALVDYTAAVGEFHSQAQKAMLSSAGGTDKLDALLSKRADIVAGIEQVATVLVQFGVLPAMPDIPKAPASKGGSAKGRGVKVSGAQYYTIIGGTERAPADSQNTLSSIAYYRGADLLDMLEENEGKHNVPASQLLQAIENAGQDPKAATPWEVELPGGKIGMRVVN